MLRMSAVPVVKSVFTCFLKARPYLVDSYFTFLHERGQKDPAICFVTNQDLGAGLGQTPCSEVL